jgi:hypothetical protein
MKRILFLLLLLFPSAIFAMPNDKYAKDTMPLKIQVQDFSEFKQPVRAAPTSFLVDTLSTKNALFIVDNKIYTINSPAYKALNKANYYLAETITDLRSDAGIQRIFILKPKKKQQE